MAASDSLSLWIPPPLSLLTPGNCDNGTSWAAKLLGLEFRRNQEDFLEPLGSGLSYLESTIPDNWTTPPSNSSLAAWYVQLHMASKSDSDVFSFWSSMVRDAVFSCRDKICNKLPWERDGDTYGVGMEISYFIIAFMSVIWFVANIVGDLPIMDAHRARKTMVSRIMRGFQETSSDFLDAALVFSAALLLAGVTRFAKTIKHPEMYYSAYGLLGSIFMSTFGIFPALVLQTVTDRVRRHWLRLFLWLVVIISCAILDIFYHVVYDRDKWFSGDDWEHNVGYEWQAHAVGVIWLRRCNGNGSDLGLKKILTFGHVWLGINLFWWFWYFAASVVPQPWIDQRRVGIWHHLFQRLQKLLLFLNGCICIFAMFLLLIYFKVYTERLLNDHPEANNDENWSFGQVLALASWAPTIVQFFSITLFGKKGLSARFSWRYEVVETKQPLPVSKQQRDSEQGIPSP